VQQRDVHTSMVNQGYIASLGNARFSGIRVLGVVRGEVARLLREKQQGPDRLKEGRLHASVMLAEWRAGLQIQYQCRCGRHAILTLRSDSILSNHILINCMS
jgi:hypothetical protein